MASPDTGARAKELGLKGPFSFWVNGRAGALGDVSADVAAAAIGFMDAAMVRQYWDGRPGDLAPIDVAKAYAECAARWGREALVDVASDDLAELDQLARKLVDGAEPSIGALFAGWKDVPVPEDPAGAVAVTLNVCREMRGSAHLSAVQAAGIGALGAIMSADDQVRGGPAGAERFGWSEPFPAADKVRRAEAERMTSAICLPAYARLSSDELQRFTELVHIVRGSYGQ